MWIGCLGNIPPPPYKKKQKKISTGPQPKHSVGTWYFHWNTRKTAPYCPPRRSLQQRNANTDALKEIGRRVSFSRTSSSKRSGSLRSRRLCVKNWKAWVEQKRSKKLYGVGTECFKVNNRSGGSEDNTMAHPPMTAGFRVSRQG